MSCRISLHLVPSLKINYLTIDFEIHIAVTRTSRIKNRETLIFCFSKRNVFPCCLSKIKVCALLQKFLPFPNSVLYDWRTCFVKCRGFFKDKIFSSMVIFLHRILSFRNVGAISVNNTFSAISTRTWLHLCQKTPRSSSFWVHFNLLTLFLNNNHVHFTP